LRARPAAEPPSPLGVSNEEKKEERGGAAPSDESKRGSLLGPPLFARWPCLRLSARGTRARGATQNGRWCCHQRPLCRAPPCGGHGRSGRRLRSQPRRLELRRLASRTSTALLHLHPSRPFRACLSAVPDLFAPPVRPQRARLAPAAWSLWWAHWPTAGILVPRPCGPACAEPFMAADWPSSRLAAALAIAPRTYL
jgi:hypothetical protein